MLRRDAVAGFRAHFKTQLFFNDPLMAMVARVQSGTAVDYFIDAIKFDEWLIKVHGYDIEQHGSTYDFVQKKFGDKALAFLKRTVGMEEQEVIVSTEDSGAVIISEN